MRRITERELITQLQMLSDQSLISVGRLKLNIIERQQMTIRQVYFNVAVTLAVLYWYGNLNCFTAIVIIGRFATQNPLYAVLMSKTEYSLHAFA